MNKGCIVVLGMFDGVHIGHQALLHKATELKNKTALPVVLLTFETHPKALFDRSPIMLTDNCQKEQLCISYGVDKVFFLPFNEGMRRMSPESFVTEYLIKKMNAQHVIVGENYRFGYCHTGTPETLAGYKEFETHVIPSVCLDGEIVCSTRIRALLEEGNLEQALKYLGHPLEVEGEVVFGRQVGRTLGFPTANLRGNFPPLCHGVYFTRAFIDGEWANAISNFGTLPTFSTSDEPRLESHLLQFTEDLYQKQMKVQFLYFLRKEMKFGSPEKLSLQVKSDIQKAHKYFSD